MTKNKEKKGFTLVELLVAITISSILFLFLFTFSVDTLDEIKDSKRKTAFFSSFSNFNIKMKNFSLVFPKYSHIIDKASGNGMDIILLKNLTDDFGIAIGIVEKGTMKFATDYENYSEKVLGYLELTESQLLEISGNPNKIYDYKIFDDKIFPGIYLKDFQTKIYNSNSILELELYLIPYYSLGLEGNSWNDIDKKEFFKLILNF